MAFCASWQLPQFCSNASSPGLALQDTHEFSSVRRNAFGLIQSAQFLQFSKKGKNFKE